MADNTYIPGVCNLGRAEIRTRWIAAWLGIVITLVCLIVFSFVSVPWYFRMLIFFPASLAIAGVLQARLQFCVKYGFQGVFNVGSDLGKTDTVEQAEFRKKDREKAILIAGGGASLSAVLTAVVLAYF